MNSVIQRELYLKIIRPFYRKDLIKVFIAKKNGEKRYIQIALRIEGRKTMEREFGSLLAVKDNYPKYVITLDEITGTSYRGIQHLSLRKFLTQIDF